MKPIHDSQGIKRSGQVGNPSSATMDTPAQGMGGGMPSPQPPVYGSPAPPKLSANVNMNPPHVSHINPASGDELQSYTSNSNGFAQMGQFQNNSERQSAQMYDQMNYTHAHLYQQQQQQQQQQYQQQQQKQQQQQQQQLHHMNLVQQEQMQVQQGNLMGRISSLIPPSEMANPIALGNAMNKMYEGLLTALNKQTSDTNLKFKEILRDITSIKETSNSVSDRLTQAMEQIDALKLSKADSGALQLVADETKVFKDEIVKRAGEQDEKLLAMENRINGMSSALENNRCGIGMVRTELHWTRDTLKLENDRIRNYLSQQVERVKVLEIKQNRLHLNIDGVPEDTSINPALLIVNKLNSDTDAELTEADFKSAWRVGTYIPDKSSRPAARD